MTTKVADFALADGIDIDRLRSDYQRDGHVRIGPFLTDAAARTLAAHLDAREDWRIVLNSDEKLFEIDRPTAQSMTSQQWGALNQAVLEAARHGFQFRYGSIRVPDAPAVAASARRLRPLHGWAGGAGAGPGDHRQRGDRLR